MLLQSNVQKYFVQVTWFYQKWNFTMISANRVFVNMIQQWADFLTSETQFITKQERDFNSWFLTKDVYLVNLTITTLAPHL